MGYTPYYEDFACTAVTSLPFTASASMLMRIGSLNLRVGSTDDASAGCDQVESMLDDGPCVLAMQEQHSVFVPDLATEVYWPEWRREALRAGFRSSLSLATVADARTDTAVSLNLYSEVEDPWGAVNTDGLDRSLRALGSWIAIRISISDATERVLPHSAPDAPARRARAVEAIGLLNGCGPQEAEDMLRKAGERRTDASVTAIERTVLAIVADGIRVGQ